MAEDEYPLYQVYGEYLVQEVDGCTGGSCGTYGHEPGCGMEPIAKVEDILVALVDLERARKVSQEMVEIRIALEQVPVYEGLVDVSPVAMLVSELVRDHAELEARIDAVMMYLKNGSPSILPGKRLHETTREVARLLQGGSRVPDTLEGLDDGTS